MHAVILARLDTHVPRTEVLDPLFRRHLARAVLEHLQRLVALALDPLVRLLEAGGVGRDEETRPQGLGQVRRALERGGEDAVEPVLRRLEVEVVPEAVAEDEGVWSAGLGGGEEGLEAGDFVRVEGEAEHHLDDEVDVLLRGAGEGVRVVLADGLGGEDALDGAGFDVELRVAEALPSFFEGWAFYQFLELGKEARARNKIYSQFLVVEIPSRHGPVAEILPEQDIQRPDHVSHHAVSDHDDLLESCKDLTDPSRGVPAHVAVSGHERCLESDSAATRDGREKRLPVRAEWRERLVQVQR